MTMGRSIVRCFAAIALSFVCIALNPISAEVPFEIKNIVAKGDLGSASTISCTASPENADVTWKFNGHPLPRSERIKVTELVKKLNETDNDGAHKKIKVATISIANTTHSDAGEYTCECSLGTQTYNKSKDLDLHFPSKLINNTKGPITTYELNHENVTLTCVFEVYNASEVIWYQKGEKEKLFINGPVKQINPKRVESTHSIIIESLKDNGTYICELHDADTDTKVYGSVDIIVYDPPTIKIDKVIAVNTTELYLNWTVNPNNMQIIRYTIFCQNVSDNSDNFQMCGNKVDISNTSFVITGLKKSNKYRVKIEVITRITDTMYFGSSYHFSEIVETLAEEPIFVPNISISVFGSTDLTITWAPPPPDFEQFIHFYLMEARKKNDNVSRKAYVYPSKYLRNLSYVFDNLRPHSTYVFRVSACSDYTKRCGKWSEEMEGATLDGIPTNVLLVCGIDYVALFWEPPNRPYEEVKEYSVELTGNITYLDQYGKEKCETWGPLTNIYNNKEHKFPSVGRSLAPGMKPVRVNGMVRSRRHGDEVTANCTGTPNTPPQYWWIND